MNLIEDNMNLVYSAISKYYPTFSRDDDIIQCGMIGLCNAANNWDESKSAFSTYAFKCILNEIRQELRKRKRHITGISLDQDMCENATLAEALVGDEDVNFLDFDGFYDNLTPREKEVWKLTQDGNSTTKIGKKLGCSHETVARDIRTIKLKWRKFNGNSD